jgi:hypothetical protein
MQTINLTQAKRSPISHNVYMSVSVNSTTDAKGRVNISPPLDVGQSITLNVFLRVRARADGSSSHTNINITADMALYKNGTKIVDCTTFATSAGGDNHTHTDVTVSIPDVKNGDILEIRQIKFDSAYFTSGVHAYGEGAGYMRLDSADDGWDSFNVTSLGQQYWSVTKYYNPGLFNSAVSSGGTADINWVDGPDS